MVQWVFENKLFEQGTRDLSETIAKSSAFSIAAVEKHCQPLISILIQMMYHIVQQVEVPFWSLWKAKFYHQLIS